MRPALRTLPLWMMLLAATASDAAALRCGNDLVNTGDHAYVLLARCGEPDHRETIVGHFLPGLGFPVERKRWFYNFGPSRFLQVVEIRDDRVRTIDTAGYGFHPDTIRGRCQPNDLRAGMTKLELLTRCGDPDYRSRRLETLPTPPEQNVRALRRSEEWLYDLEGQDFLRVLRIRDGIVRDVELGARP